MKEVIAELQEQLQELRNELLKYQQTNRRFVERIDDQAHLIMSLKRELEQERANTGKDIEALYNKAKDVIERQTNCQLAMRPADLVRLWIHYFHLASQFALGATGKVADWRFFQHFEQQAIGLAHQLIDRGDLVSDTPINVLLENLVFPYIIVTVGQETLSWKELREKYAGD